MKKYEIAKNREDALERVDIDVDKLAGYPDGDLITGNQNLKEKYDPRRINLNDNLDNESPDMDNEDNYTDNDGSEASQKIDYK